MAEPRNCSPSPRPTTSGHSLRAATMHAGLVGGHRDERVVAAQLGVGAADGVLEPAAVEVARRQVRDDLGVGLRREHGAGVEELLLELHVVLDDAVDDDVHAVGGVVVRVGVLLGHAAVRGPARVADAGGGRWREHRDAAIVTVALLDRAAQLREVADGADGLQAALALDRDAGGVVPAVFELLEPVQKDLLDRAVTDVADDPAHGDLLDQNPAPPIFAAATAAESLAVAQNTIVRPPSAITRSSRWLMTARASTPRSMSRPTRSSSAGLYRWSTRTTSCSMIGPGVQLLGHVVRGGADELDAALAGPAVRVGAREGRQERVVDVDHRAPTRSRKSPLRICM